jgi:Trk K+ transport system NAD-binding subunit
VLSYSTAERIGVTVAEHRVLLCGLGRVGWRTLQSLQATGVTVTVVTLKGEEHDARLNGAKLIQGDCREQHVLERAGLATMTGVVIVTSDDVVNVSTALLARKLNPTCRIVVRMFNQSLLARLGTAVRNTVALSVSALTAPLMALTAISGESLAAFTVQGEAQQIVQLAITADSPWFGKTLADMGVTNGVRVVGFIPNRGAITMLGETRLETILADGDRVVLLGEPEKLSPLLQDGTSATVRSASILWRGLRAFKRLLLTVDRPVLWATLVLLLTLVGSSIVLAIGTGISWIDGFYNTVSIMATGADLHGDGKEPWVKMFIGGLKLVGAALLATFTAIITNALLKARLGSAFEALRLPESGHVVVCGLGNIGYRCVRELLQLQARVVVIEPNANSPFAATVRRMGVPVIVGDATIPEVLHQAHASTARAVIAATDEDLLNLEIALLVRELKVQQRVVVRMNDPDLAASTREAADIRYAVSPPALAAPAFAAALFGDRIQALIAVGSRNFAVVELQADEGEQITGRTLDSLCKEWAMLSLDKNIPTDRPLAVGDKLTTLIELQHLERLIQR